MESFNLELGSVAMVGVAEVELGSETFTSVTIVAMNRLGTLFTIFIICNIFLDLDFEPPVFN